MKKTLVFLSLGMFCFLTGIYADKTGVGAERNQDRTGSPVATSTTQQCDKCHSGNNFNTAVQLRLKDSGGNVVTEYNGGESYTYEVEVTGTGNRFGFQTVALLTSNANAGNMTASSSNSKITIMNSRRYAEHTGASTSGLFVMNWVAPAPGSGTVKFYASGNNVNNNNASSGDDPQVATPLTITESAVSGINEEKENDFESILFYPNPADSYVHLALDEVKEFQIHVYDATGRLILEKSVHDSYFNLDVSAWDKGIYFVTFTGEINGTKNFIR